MDVLVDEQRGTVAGERLDEHAGGEDERLAVDLLVARVEADRAARGVLRSSAAAGPASEATAAVSLACASTELV